MAGAPATEPAVDPPAGQITYLTGLIMAKVAQVRTTTKALNNSLTTTGGANHEDEISKGQYIQFNQLLADIKTDV